MSGVALDATPRQRLAAACATEGTATVAQACAALLEGRAVDDRFVLVVGGRHGLAVLEGRDREYWLRVWGARGLLYAWDDAALASLRAGARDEHWRVREMTAKVVARHRLDALAGEVARLRDDEVPRVRAAAQRALERLAAAAPDPPGRGEPR